MSPFFATDFLLGGHISIEPMNSQVPVVPLGKSLFITIPDLIIEIVSLKK